MKTVYITESLCCTAEINTTLDINFTSIKEKKKTIHPPLAWESNSMKQWNERKQVI